MIDRGAPTHAQIGRQAWGPQMDHAGAAVERRRGGDCRLGHCEDGGIFHRRARRRADVVSVTIIVMMRDILVRVRWHLIDVTGGMDRELNARDASPARSAAWAMPEKLVRTSIRHVRKGKKARTSLPLSRKGFHVIALIRTKGH
jgi:hypothetical protein